MGKRKKGKQKQLTGLLHSSWLRLYKIFQQGAPPVLNLTMICYLLTLARACAAKGYCSWSIGRYAVGRSVGLKALGHDISKRFVTKFKGIVRGPSFR